ncbi:endolytic peptidoglycan transglycosylase RlpA [Enterobacter sp.]|uniref:endolytic peptidoglycan transglycosylase RlpA n=1 Tax=Enterobacter sp. TaxID=42895 RepID=UPI00296EE985|nr:endolytic peptidoglycan transglycosylase RlpA [Enterobacter sp.]
MRKLWLAICIAGSLAACTSDDGQQQTTVAAPQPAVCNGPIVEIGGAEPRYEAPNPSVNQDYERDGKNYKIVQDPTRFSQAGLAAIYDAEPGSNLTASGEAFDPMQLTAAHPTLPVPSYARITNLANGRMIVVRINDRGPYGNDRVIALSRAAADRLNNSNNTKVRIDPIVVAQDGTLSGPGTACTTVAKQTYALPARPDLSGGLGSASTMPAPAQPEGNVQAISNDTLKSEDTMGAPVSSGGFLGAPTTLANGVLEGNEAPVEAPQPVVAAPVAAPVSAPATPNAPVTAPGSVQGSVAPAAPAAAPAASGYVVQVGAVSDQARAQQYQQRLAQQFAVPGRVAQNGAVWRIQLGPFSSKADAAALQQRLQSEAQLQSFITNAQ